MSEGRERIDRGAAKRCSVLAACALVWVAWLDPPTLHAQGTPSSTLTPAPPTAAIQPERALDELHAALEHARFDEARTRASALLAGDQLSARQRNEVLELLAVAQIAARDEVGARATLSLLYARDPAHRERLRDPGPSVSAAFARARNEGHEPLVPLLGAQVARDPAGRALVEVELGAGRDAIDSLHLFVRRADGERAHLVAEAGSRAAVRFALPAASSPADGGQLSLWLEARAPSGSVLSRAGTDASPLQFSLPPSTVCQTQAPPLRRAWWLWTSVAITVAGIGVSGAIVAR